MKYSIVNYKETFTAYNDYRLDADYYHSDFIHLINSISKKYIITLNDNNFYITDGEHGSPCWDVNTNIKYITAENIKPNYIEENDFKTISIEQDERNKRSRLRQNDILIYSVGVFAGYAALAEPHLFPANIPRSVAIIRLKKYDKLIPEYVCVFINSKYGQFQTKRLQAGNAQPMLALEKISKLRIVCLNIEFQKIIKRIYNKSYELRRYTTDLYQQSLFILNKELDIENWTLKHKLWSVRKYSNVKDANRLDAEYFQPKYDEILKIIRESSNGYDILGNIVSIKKGIEVGSDEYQENGIPFVRVSNLNKFEINENNQQYISQKAYDRLALEYQPQKCEILLSKDGTAGIAYYLNETPPQMIISGGILRLTITDSEYLPEYLTLVLNSILVQQQIERTSSGALIQHWLINEINSTLIPKLDIQKQKEIVGKIQESTKCRKQSKQLLEIAKRGVEIAIEQDEDIATNWINQELQKIGVEL